MLIHRAHPLAKGLSYAWHQPRGMPRNSAMLPELIRRQNGTFSGTQRWGIIDSRAHVQHVSTDSPTIDCGNLDFTGVTHMTIFAIGWRAAATGWWSIGRHTTLAHRIGIYALDTDVFVSFENGAASAPAVTFSTTRRFSVAATYNADESGWDRVRLWINGARRTLATGGTSPPASLATRAEPWEFGPHRPYSGYTDGTFERCYLWIGRALSDTDIWRLHHNPDCILAPPEPLWFASSGVGIPIFLHHSKQQGIA